MAKESERKKPKRMTHGEMIELVAKVAADTAISRYKAEQEERNRSICDKRFKNTKELLKQYRSLRDYASNAVFDTEQLFDFDTAILSIGVTNSDKFKVESVKNQVAYTKVIMQHVETMLFVYKMKCLGSAKDEVRRRWRVVESMYIVGDSTPEISDIAIKESIDGRTVYRDLDKACDEISTLIFGLDLTNIVI